MASLTAEESKDTANHCSEQNAIETGSDAEDSPSRQLQLLNSIGLVSLGRKPSKDTTESVGGKEASVKGMTTSYLQAISVPNNNFKAGHDDSNTIKDEALDLTAVKTQALSSKVKLPLSQGFKNQPEVASLDSDEVKHQPQDLHTAKTNTVQPFTDHSLTAVPFGNNNSKCKPLSNSVEQGKRDPGKFPEPDVVIGIVEPHVRTSNRKRPLSHEDPMDLTAKKPTIVVISSDDVESKDDSHAMDLSVKPVHHPSASEKSSTNTKNPSSTSPDVPLNFSMTNHNIMESSPLKIATKVWRSRSEDLCKSKASQPTTTNFFRRSSSMIPNPSEKGTVVLHDHTQSGSPCSASASTAIRKQLSLPVKNIKIDRPASSFNNTSMRPPQKASRQSSLRSPEIVPSTTLCASPKQQNQVRLPTTSQASRPHIAQLHQHYRTERPSNSGAKSSSAIAVSSSIPLWEQHSSVDLTKNEQVEQQVACVKPPIPPPPPAQEPQKQESLPLDLRTAVKLKPKELCTSVVAHPEQLYISGKDQRNPPPLLKDRNRNNRKVDLNLAAKISSQQPTHTHLQHTQSSSKSTVHHQQHVVTRQISPYRVSEMPVPQYRPAEHPQRQSAGLPQYRMAEIPQYRATEIPQYRVGEISQQRTANIPQHRPSDIVQYRPGETPQVRTDNHADIHMIGRSAHPAKSGTFVKSPWPAMPYSVHQTTEESRQLAALHPHQYIASDRPYQYQINQIKQRAPNVVINQKINPTQFQRNLPLVDQRIARQPQLPQPPQYPQVSPQAIQDTQRQEEIYAMRAESHYSSIRLATYSRPKPYELSNSRGAGGSMAVNQSYPTVDYNRIPVAQQLSPNSGLPRRVYNNGMRIEHEPPQLQAIPCSSKQWHTPYTAK